MICNDKLSNSLSNHDKKKSREINFLRYFTLEFHNNSKYTKHAKYDCQCRNVHVKLFSVDQNSIAIIYFNISKLQQIHLIFWTDSEGEEIRQREIVCHSLKKI